MNLITNIVKTTACAAVLLTVSLFAVTTPVYAGTVPNNQTKSKQTGIWLQVEENLLPKRASRANEFGKYRVFRAEEKRLKNVLAQAEWEFSDAARARETILEIPTPEGKIVRFRIEETPVLAAEVAAQFPTWKTFIGKGVDDPTATASFDFNANGFHGYVVGADGTFVIDPYSLGDRKNYVVYYKGTFGGRESFHCDVADTDTKKIQWSYSVAAPMAFSNGTTLRTYKLAVSATKEYTNFFGGNQTTAFAAIQTTVSRMNVVYRRELAVTFTLVSDTRTVFTNANNGGFPAASDSNVADASLNRNQTVLDTTYGNTNYDIGHALSMTPNPNGLASSPSLCDPSAKAQGFTGAPTPQGDGFDVDYVAHEIGHQFSMSHTFNNDTDGSCTTRSADSAFEPASGVTIMGYGGICAPRNLAANSIEFFNLRSLDQSIGYLQNDVPSNYPTCGANTATGNTPPAVSVAAASYNIPKQTPFTLTASATDANGDALTYLWEEADLGAATRSTGAVDTDEDGNARPIFRAYNPTSSASRTFPSLYYILNNANVPPLTYTGTLPFAPTSGSTAGYVCAAGETCVTGERLPSIARTMSFRVTVRDNNANGGGIRDASTSVVVSAAAGPFQLTTQNATAQSFAPEATWQAGTTQTVTWDVANTNAAPISAANVNILLSTDGGNTFPITLVANTPNDGSQAITVPNNPTTTARIKVEAVGNIFFDINNVNFAITAPTAASVSVGGRVTTQTGRAIARARVVMTDQNGDSRSATTNAFGYFTFANVNAGQTYVVSVAAKGRTFAAQTLSANENVSSLVFRAE